MQHFIKQNPVNDQHLPKIYPKCLVDVCFGFEMFAPTTVVVTNEETSAVCACECAVGSNLIYSLAQRSNPRFAISNIEKHQITGGLEGRFQNQKVKSTNDRLFDYFGSSFFILFQG